MQFFKRAVRREENLGKRKRGGFRGKKGSTGGSPNQRDRGRNAAKKRRN